MGDGSGYCPTHLASKRRTYDRERRPEHQKLYDTQAWRKLRDRKITANPVCELCGNALATLVHHINPIETHWELRLEWDNLQSSCRPCHDDIHKRMAAGDTDGHEG